MEEAPRCSCAAASRRHASLAQAREQLLRTLNFAAGRTPTAKLRKSHAGKAGRVKHSLSLWDRFATVDHPADEAKDWDHTSSIRSFGGEGGRMARCREALLVANSWLLPALIGFLTAATGSYIERAAEVLSSLRFGYCAGNDLAAYFSSPEACGEGWVSWPGVAAPPDAQPAGAFYRGMLLYVLVSVALASASALLVWCFAPTARGSGIPEVKTILGGFVMSEVLEFKTLVVKVIGLAFSVSSGMALGKEGPLVHVACCWANFCSKLSPRYMENEGKRRELISTAAAAGVSVAFGAPVGGVLFSFEEVSTMFPQKTMVRAFFAAVIAALTLVWYDPTGTGKLTMFEAFYPEMPAAYEYPWFVVLGIFGGVFGALFVHLNIKVSAGRMDGTPFRRRVPIVLEVALIALLTAATSYPSRYARDLSPVTIRALFHSCNDQSGPRPSAPDMMGLCDGLEPLLSSDLVVSLLIAAALRFAQMTITFGTGVPCGLFVPSLFTGACVGRCVGIGVRMINTHVLLVKSTINPGVYAMVGAAAMLGGVCRVTISLVVIMFELTGGLELVVPFMLAVLTAKWVGDYFTHGIYDDCIRLRGYPYLHEPDDFTFGARACDIMDEEIECLLVHPGTLGKLEARLSDVKFSGLPLIRSESDRSLLGYVPAAPLRKHLQELLRDNQLMHRDFPVVFKKFVLDGCTKGALDLSKFVDEAAFRIVPETPLAQVHNIFRQLGVKLVLVTRYHELVGMITKKSYLHHLEAGAVGHVVEDPAIQRSEGQPMKARRAGSDDVLAVQSAAWGALPDAPARRATMAGARPGGGNPASLEDGPRLPMRKAPSAPPWAAHRKASRRESLKQMRDRFVETMGRAMSKPTSYIGPTAYDGDQKKRQKVGLSKWGNFSTVSIPAEEFKDYQEHTQQVRAKGSYLERAVFHLAPWLIPGMVGLLTATTGSIIEVASAWLSSTRFGYCAGSWFHAPEACAPGQWVQYFGSAPLALLSWDAYLHKALAYVGVSVALAGASALLVQTFAPTARGSGIPEVKTILGGFVMPEVLSFRTLVVKIVGLALSVSSGMSLGKEGPLVHVACCWATFCSRLNSRYMSNEGKQRELISTAAAAGVSVAFGAPLGGVLFSYEEVSTMFPQKTMIRSFFAAVVAALALAWWDPTGNGKLTMFQTLYTEMPAFAEYPLFLLLGAGGGVLGALFVRLNVWVSSHRLPGTAFRERVPIVAEVVVIALLTAVTSFPGLYTRDLSVFTIRALFHSCQDKLLHRPSPPNMMDLCDGPEPLLGADLIQSLVLAAAARYVQMIFTFGTGVPCGLFVPSLFTGACLGRCVGILARGLNESLHFAPGAINPGVYAMVGAAAVLGGVCRVTISLVVIMFELTGGLQLIVPFMLAILTAKWVGDAFTDGIYDCYIVLRGYPYLHEPHDVTFQTRACDIMDEDIQCINAEPGSVGELLDTLREAEFGGFPLIRSEEDRTLLGYLHRDQVRQHLEQSLQHPMMSKDLPVRFSKYSEKPKRGLDLSKFVDETVVRLVPETPLAQVHNIFRQLGIKVVLVARFGELVGIITKKSFVHHLHEGHIGHVANDPAVLCCGADADGVVNSACGGVYGAEDGPRPPNPEAGDLKASLLQS